MPPCTNQLDYDDHLLMGSVIESERLPFHMMWEDDDLLQADTRLLPPIDAGHEIIDVITLQHHHRTATTATNWFNDFDFCNFQESTAMAIPNLNPLLAHYHHASNSNQFHFQSA